MFRSLWSLFATCGAVVSHGYNDHDLTKVASAIATAVNPWYADGQCPPDRLVSLEDTTGWCPTAQDVAHNETILSAILLHVASMVPALGFLVLALQLANKMVDDKLLDKHDPAVCAWKYAGMLKTLVQHLRYLRRASPRSRCKILQRLKNQIVFLEDNPFRRPQLKGIDRTWQRALENVNLVTLEGVEDSAKLASAVVEESLPSQPGVADLAALSTERLAEMALQKLHLEHDDDVCIVGIKGPEREDLGTVDISDDEMHDVVEYDCRGYDQDTIQADQLLSIKGVKLDNPMVRPELKDIIELVMQDPAVLAQNLVSTSEAADHDQPPSLPAIIGVDEAAGDEEVGELFRADSSLMGDDDDLPEEMDAHAPCDDDDLADQLLQHKFLMMQAHAVEEAAAPLALAVEEAAAAPPAKRAKAAAQPKAAAKCKAAAKPNAASEVTAVDKGLPSTWKVETRFRVQGKASGAKYFVYASPQGKNFDSLKKAKMHIMEAPTGEDEPGEDEPGEDELPPSDGGRCPTCALRQPVDDSIFKHAEAGWPAQVEFLNSLPAEIIPYECKRKNSVFMRAHCGAQIQVNWEKKIVRLERSCQHDWSPCSFNGTKVLRVEDHQTKDSCLVHVQQNLCPCKVVCFNCTSD